MVFVLKKFWFLKIILYIVVLIFKLVFGLLNFVDILDFFKMKNCFDLGFWCEIIEEFMFFKRWRKEISRWFSWLVIIFKFFYKMCGSIF